MAAWALLLMAWLAGCSGEPWPDGNEMKFALECAHAEASCESCHPSDQPIGPVDEACASCHLDDRPMSHDPATTGTCSDCHEGACGWDSVTSPHPPGFSEPELHGLVFDLQDPSEGDCRECHGEDLSGGDAQGCDDCHAREGHPEWRTECTFCHGGVEGTSGAPPEDIDNTTDPTAISFRAHMAHVEPGTEYRALPCSDCHTDHNDIFTPDHIYDATPGVGEAVFGRSPSPATVWDGTSCSSNYCHGAGQRNDGTVADGNTPLDCDSCHRTTSQWGQMSGFHETHLEEPGIVCNDCHSAIVDRSGTVVTGPRHVNGLRDVSFFEPAMSRDPVVGTCLGTCHGYDHQGEGWGHVPGYEDPGLHGIDANLQASDCTACHGADWSGGVAQGCDDCHASEGHADWRTDCTFCHGGENGDVDGLPPQDIDDETDEALISFGAHPEHARTGGIGHPAYGCDQCHVMPGGALSPGHAIDDTPGVAEVDLSGGLSWEGGYDPVAVSCSTMYCHGDGHEPSGTIADAAGPLTCDSCHPTTTNQQSMSGTHASHLSEGITCSECHAPVVNASNVIVTPSRHVDRVLDLDIGATGYQAGAQTCTITCHGQTHDAWYWTGPHPPGYDAAEVHGQEALQLTQDCTDCHGADLRGGSGQSCDNCHQPGWRTNCTYCHGGANGDTEGLPPQDIDDQANEDLISFKAHPEHADGDIHPLWGCEVCHGNASRNYNDAFTDVGHWIDSTPGVAEVAFTGDAAGTSYGGGNCTNSWCHGDGQTRGSSTDGTVALDCNGCHRYDFDLGAMSGTHALHLNDPTISCADCHTPIVDASGAITTPARHVDGTVDVAAVAIGWDAPNETCTNNCHQHQHGGVSWNGGHVPGYDDPLLHGQDALFVTLDCATAGCHGTDLQGGASGQGCDSCHTANWSRDCTYCHGGRLGDTEGLPPEDLDNTTNQNQITFKAHPEHADGDDHVAYGCDECHGAASIAYVDAKTDVGHWRDGSPGRAEVVFSAGLSSAGTYAFASSTCSNLYCHGNGRTNGNVTDSATAGTCNDCHPQNRLSGEHGRHLGANSDCSDCHYSVVRNGDNVQFPNKHVDGTTDVQMDPSTGLSWNGSTCSGGRCHGVEHSHNGDRW